MTVLRLAERDAELNSLRSALAEQQAATPVPGGGNADCAYHATGQRVPSNAAWPFLRLATLLVGADSDFAAPAPKCCIRQLTHRRTRPLLRRSTLEVVDPQIMASKRLRRPRHILPMAAFDQAVEVLNDALAEGLTSVALIMCLLECHIELEQFAEAGAPSGVWSRR